MSDIRFPIRRGPGKPSRESDIRYTESLRAFAMDLRALQRGLDFQMGTRDWCYYLENNGLAKGDFDWAEAQIVEARLRGFLRPGFILEEDGHRVEEQPCLEYSAEEWVETKLCQYRDAKSEYLNSWESYGGVDFWADKDCFLQLFVEKAGLKSLFHPLCEAYFIPLASMRGWGSLEQFAVFARNFEEHEEQGRRPVLLAVNDFDPAGLVISRDLRARFETYARFTGWDPEALEVERVGLNYDFIQKHQLTWIDGLETGSGKDLGDPKHPCYKRNTYDIQGYIGKYGKRKVEANAIVVVPELGRRMLEDAIKRYVGYKALDEYNESLDSIRAEIREALVVALEEGGQP